MPANYKSTVEKPYKPHSGGMNASYPRYWPDNEQTVQLYKGAIWRYKFVVAVICQFHRLSPTEKIEKMNNPLFL